MMLFLKKNLSFLPCSYKNPSFSLFFLSSATATKNPPFESHFMVDYLKSSVGFSSDKANEVSKTLSHLTSTHKPDSALQFLKLHGFDDTDIRNLISSKPRILCANVKKTLEPNLRALLELDFTAAELKQIIAANPYALLIRGTARRFGFWRTLFNDNKKHLMMAFTRNRGLIAYDIEKNITPKIALLKEHGLSEDDVKMLIIRGHGFIMRSIASMEVLVKKAKELGFPPNSSMFGQGLSSLSSITSVRFKAKMDLFGSFGWSQEEFRAAMRRSPYLVHHSEAKIREKMKFLVGRAGCTQSYIASRPLLLNFSLEKRLMPRYHVMKIVKSNELIGKEWNIDFIMNLSEQNFVERIILRYKVEAPALYETYLAACAGHFD